KDQMSEGKISFEMVESAFKSATAEGGAFHGMADKMSQTFGGKLSSMMDAFSTTLIELYGVLQPMLIPAIDFLTKAIEGIVPTFQWLVQEFSNGNPILWGLAGIIGVVTGAIIAYNIHAGIAALRTKWLAKETKIQVLWDKLLKVGTIAKTAVMWAFNAAGWAVTTMLSRQKMATVLQNTWNWVATASTGAWRTAMLSLNAAMLANPIGLIIVAIAGLIALVVMSIKKYESWGATMLMLMGPVGWLINGIMALKRNWQSVSDAFSKGGILAGLKRIGIVLLDAVLYPVQQLLKMLAKIPGLSYLAGKGVDKIAQIRKNLNLVPDEAKKTPAEKQHKANVDNAKKQSGKGKSDKVDDKVFKSLYDNKNEKDKKKNGKGSKGTSTGDQVSKVTGAGQETKNITVNIDSFVKGGINTANTTLGKMDAKEMENWFNEMLLRTIRNLELAQ
ncbi:MAG TPA: hypothetical protein PLP27_05640, partial [Crocinitomicaceae bacterium]|nr:hypothetical protein [Crocinitomicaceae bacterium]